MSTVASFGSGPKEPPPPKIQDISKVDLSNARKAYATAIRNPELHHAEVGVLSPEGIMSCDRLGLAEAYGAHRVGSVTKTFTAFLALKLVNDGILLNGLQTKCKEIIPLKDLQQVFQDPGAAGNMTLEQLLSHTSGLDCDDHSRTYSGKPCTSLSERFLLEPVIPGGHKYVHVSKPGDNIGFYSNAGLAVACWMMEVAYNQYRDGLLGSSNRHLPFADIMKKEIFEGVFDLSDSIIAPGPSGDIIQSGAGDMTSSVVDLLKVAARLQKGESELERYFGKKWQSRMLQPRDIFQHHGIGCTANAAVIKHAGMNREKFGSEERDVTAIVQFPLHPGQPGLVAMCDSCALGPEQEFGFIRELEVSAGIAKPKEVHKEPVYDLGFFCPSGSHVFHGNDYLVTNVDPFTQNPNKISCSRSGMKHELTRDMSLDKTDVRGYRDENGNPWLLIAKADGSKTIYSGLCLLTKAVGLGDLSFKQPGIAEIRKLVGVYRDAENPDDHPTFMFTEKDGHLYFKEDQGKSYPCLYVPDEAGGSWVVSNPTGRKIKIKFPANPNQDSLYITDIFTGIQQPPYHSKRK